MADEVKAPAVKDAAAPAGKDAPAKAPASASNAGASKAGAAKAGKAKGGPINKLLLLGGALTAAAAVAAAVVFLVVIPKLRSAGSSSKSATVSEATLGPVFEVKDLVINSADQEELHYFKVGVAVEVKDAGRLKELSARDPQIRDMLISEFSQHTIRELNTAGGRENVRRSLLRKLNRQLGGASLKNLFFTEYVAQ